VLIALVVRTVAFEPFNIPSGSMVPTLLVGDYLFVSKFSYGYSRYSLPFGLPLFSGRIFLPFSDLPQRGDVAVFKLPTDPSTDYIKRIVGLPGDKVEVKGHEAYVDGKKLDEPYLRPIESVEGIDDGRSNWGPKTVPKDTYLMLGDHRDNSADGRVFGFVPEDFIVGKAFMVYWPPKRFGGLPEKDPGGAEATKADPKCLEGAVPEGQSLETDG
jgi:signal peptidase I